MLKIYNKLVRDKIPEIIINDGEKPEIRKLSQKEFKISHYSIRNKKLKKNKERGSFAKKLFLIKTKLRKTRK